MSSTRPIVLHPGEGITTPLTPGMEVRQFFDHAGSWVGWAGWIRNSAGDASGWHHHADNDTYVYLIRGSLRIDFGPDGAETIVARAGDFILIPSRTVHHETTSQESDLEAFVLRIGGEPEHVNVDGPEAAPGEVDQADG